MKILQEKETNRQLCRGAVRQRVACATSPERSVCGGGSTELPVVCPAHLLCACHQDGMGLPCPLESPSSPTGVKLSDPQVTQHLHQGSRLSLVLPRRRHSGLQWVGQGPPNVLALRGRANLLPTSPPQIALW